ncbi:MAG: complex I NDUFA9 subunit family protein [Geminicoccaceae bacterium]|nr:complex I NDUFA9 subunit family protein [Geminicoccaceae bacterium]
MRNATVTVFGGSGFIGEQVVKRLADDGAMVRVPTRNPALSGYLCPLGEVGQVVPVKLAGVEPGDIDAAMAGSTHVVNLIGIMHERKAGDFDRIHGELAGTIARSASEHRVRSLVHISAIGADSGALSAYARSKAKGEEAVRDAFGDATILRPSVVFGPGDGFFHRFAEMATLSPVLPLVDGGETRFQPVYVGDVADAVLTCLGGTHAGIYELGGPEVKTFRQLLSYMLEKLGRGNRLVNVPSGILEFPARLMEYLPNPPLTRDQLLLLKRDNVVSANARTLSDLGIHPTPMEIVVPRVVKAFARPRIEVPAI